MTIEERLEKLEAELTETTINLVEEKRFMRRFLVGTGVVFGMFALLVVFQAMTGFAYSQGGEDATKIIKAKAFIVVDEKSKTRACLGVIDDGPGLVLYDDKGEGRATLAVIMNSPALSLDDEKGTCRALLAVIQSGPGMILYGENHDVLYKAP